MTVDTLHEQRPDCRLGAELWPWLRLQRREGTPRRCTPSPTPGLCVILRDVARARVRRGHVARVITDQYGVGRLDGDIGSCTDGHTALGCEVSAGASLTPSPT